MAPFSYQNLKKILEKTGFWNDSIIQNLGSLIKQRENLCNIFYAYAQYRLYCLQYLQDVHLIVNARHVRQLQTSFSQGRVEY